MSWVVRLGPNIVRFYTSILLMSKPLNTNYMYRYLHLVLHKNQYRDIQTKTKNYCILVFNFTNFQVWGTSKFPRAHQKSPFVEQNWPQDTLTLTTKKCQKWRRGPAEKRSVAGETLKGVRFKHKNGGLKSILRKWPYLSRIHFVRTRIFIINKIWIFI